jgi:CDP-diacylglycerol---serine O-phosphatidyltransferase
LKNLPNFVTLCNLFCGCIAICFIFFNAPYAVQQGEAQFWVTGNASFYWGGIFICIAGVMDFLDGMVARWLGVTTAIGGDLDSLADVVSFGVAPSCILAKLLWASHMSDPNAMDVSMLAMAPAFVLACFGALRLARFNNAPENNYFFTGTPIPSVGIAIAGLAMAVYYNNFNIATVLQNKWIIYLIIAGGSYLMVSPLKLFTVKIKGFGLAENWGRYLWLALSLLLIWPLKFLVVPVSFLLYVIISLFYTPSSTPKTN